MGSQPFLREEKNPILFLIDPHRMMDFVGGVDDQEECAKLVETPETVKAYLGFWLSPLFDKYRLVNAS